MKTAPIQTAEPILFGLALTFVATPILAWLDIATGSPGFFAILAVVAGLSGLGLLLYGVYAFLKTFDAMAARLLAVDEPSVPSRADED